MPHGVGPQRPTRLSALGAPAGRERFSRLRRLTCGWQRPCKILSVAGRLFGDAFFDGWCRGGKLATVRRPPGVGYPAFMTLGVRNDQPLCGPAGSSAES